MMKRFFSFTVFLVLLFSFFSPAYAKSTLQFQDSQNHWAQLPMEWAHEKGILTGTSPITLSPDEPTTRAMAVTVLHRYVGSPAVEGSSGFSDVPANAYYARAVTWATQAGIITGKTKATFCPDESVSREDFSVMLYRLCTARHGAPEVSLDALGQLEDAGDIHPYAKASMAWAVEDLFLVNKNLPGVSLLPQAAMFRGDLVHLLRQYDCLVEGNPAQLYRLNTAELQSVTLRLPETQAEYFINTPEELQRFVEKINSFSYTSQAAPAGAGGTFAYAHLFFKQAGTLPVTLAIQPNGINHHYGAASDSPYFSLAWLQSFAPNP